MTKAENKEVLMHTNNNVNHKNKCSWEGISYIIKCFISNTNLGTDHLTCRGGGGGYGFLFRSTRELEYLFILHKAHFFSRI